MPRPRRDSEILPAKERLENAFWTLLADRPFGKITVTDVVHEARVNRNSFYYHFSGLPELADSAIMVEIERLSHCRRCPIRTTTRLWYGTRSARRWSPRPRTSSASTTWRC